MGKETGLICTGESVRAFLDNRKSQTRRTRGLDEVNKNPDSWEPPFFNSVTRLWEFLHKQDQDVLEIKCPYGVVGDRVWVKETFCYAKMYGYDAREDGGKFWYKATDSGECEGPYISSRFMPKEAARIWLEITGIRVERVQEISEEDALREGCTFSVTPWNPATVEFRGLWDSLNAKRGYPWSDEDLPDNLKTGKGRIMYGNPWVWVLELKRISDGN